MEFVNAPTSAINFDCPFCSHTVASSIISDDTHLEAVCASCGGTVVFCFDFDDDLEELEVLSELDEIRLNSGGLL